MIIDIVYTWVDGHDPQHQALLARHADQPNHYSRFATHHELYYSLYSVDQFAPWVRQIIIVCAAYQRPVLKGLPDELLRKIRYVTQDEIMPETALPVFNSLAIETCLHQIPGLSEHFIYFNDDTFLGRPVTPWDFFSPQGECYCLVSSLTKTHRSFSLPSQAWLVDFAQTIALYQQFILHEKGKLDWFFLDKIQHQCYPCRKSILTYLANHDVLNAELEKTTHSSFRSPTNIKIIPLMYLVGEFLQLSQLKAFKSERFIMLRENIPLAWLQLWLLRVTKPTLFCINNDLEQAHALIEGMFRHFLKQFFKQAAPES
jgi:hypothetical protein